MFSKQMTLQSPSVAGRLASARPGYAITLVLRRYAAPGYCDGQSALNETKTVIAQTRQHFTQSNGAINPARQTQDKPAKRQSVPAVQQADQSQKNPFTMSKNQMSGIRCQMSEDR